MAMTLITTNTSSNAATSSFTSGIDSTYKLYIFKFININPATDATEFGFQGNASGQSGYNEAMQTTYFSPYNYENASDAAVGYDAGEDQIISDAAFQSLSNDSGNDADQCICGDLYLFNPSGTTYIKHFHSVASQNGAGDYNSAIFAAGYFNVAAAITNIQFKMSAGNFDGTIKMYGVA